MQRQVCCKVKESTVTGSGVRCPSNKTKWASASFCAPFPSKAGAAATGARHPSYKNPQLLVVDAFFSRSPHLSAHAHTLSHSPTYTHTLCILSPLSTLLAFTLLTLPLTTTNTLLHAMLSLASIVTNVVANLPWGTSKSTHICHARNSLQLTANASPIIVGLAAADMAIAAGLFYCLRRQYGKGRVRTKANLVVAKPRPPPSPRPCILPSPVILLPPQPCKAKKMVSNTLALRSMLLAAHLQNPNAAVDLVLSLFTRVRV